MSRFHSRLTCLPLIIAVAGCAEFQHPLSPPEEATFDERAFGTWFREQTDNARTTRIYMHIGKAGEVKPKGGDKNFSTDQMTDDTPVPFQNLTRVVYVEVLPNGTVRSHSWLAYPARIGDQDYVNVPHFKGRDIKGYFFYKYSLKDDEMVWSGANKDRAGKLIAAGKLHGKPDGSLVTDSTEQLHQFLQAGGGAGLFQDDEPIVFHRLRPSAPADDDGRDDDRNGPERKP